MTRKKDLNIKGRIGIIGNDSSGKKMGRKTAAIAEALKKAGYEVFVSYSGTFRQKRLDAVIAAGKHCSQVVTDKVLSYCNRTETSLICGENMAKLIDTSDISDKIHVLDAGNFKWELYTFFSFCERRGAYDHIEEIYQCQQQGKAEASKALMKLVESRYVELEWDKVVICEGIENVPSQMCTDMKIPTEHYDDFEFFRVKFKRGDTKCFVNYGRESAVKTVEWMLSILNGKVAVFLDKGRIHTVFYLVSAGY